MSAKTAKLVGLELYNLRDDVGETKNLADQQPEKLSRLVNQLRNVYAEVPAESPVWPTWKWPRYESQRIEWPSDRKRRANTATSRL